MVNMDIFTAILVYDCGVLNNLIHCLGITDIIFGCVNHIIFHGMLMEVSGIIYRGTIPNLYSPEIGRASCRERV